MLTASLALLLISCENTEWPQGLESAQEEELTIAEDEVFAQKSAESTESDVDAVACEASMKRSGMGSGGPHNLHGKHVPDCATVTVSGEDFPKTITIDYGDGCSGENGMGRTGIITIEISDSLSNEGAVSTVTFDGVTVGNKAIEKTVTRTNLGENENGNVVIGIESLMTITHETGKETLVSQRAFTGQKEWLSGFATPGKEDDIFLRSGEGSITINDTLQFTRSITSPVLIDRSCRYPLSGVVEISRNGEVMTIDYGAGECDNIALVTKDGESEEIELQSGKFDKEFRRGGKNMKKKKGWW